MLRGADEALVKGALERQDPLPGIFGFAGELDDGRLVRDVLGRVPLYIDTDAVGTGWKSWAFDPERLSDPSPFPPGSVADGDTVRQVWRLPASEPLDPDEAIAALESGMNTAVAAATGTGESAPEDKPGGDGSNASATALAFSGGIDSAYLAARFDVPLYTVGFPESHDLRVAREAAARLGRAHRVIELDLDRLADLVPTVAGAIDSTNAMDVQIAIPLYCVAKAARADGYSRLILGQGADELFGGYEKVASAPTDPRLDASTVLGARDEVLAGLPDGIERDGRVVRAADVTPITPYLHDDVIRAALQLPGSELVHDGTRKVALRRLAVDWLPETLTDRPKKAMQYGTDVSRELDRLARQAGFKRRMDDHVSQYIASRVEAAGVSDGE